MYLKALEIQGFKSFAQKTRLTFDRPVTAIVGPNGSGKSNISDALRWVMGEQSTRALRGGKMEDVIFSGTQSRSPLGFAEVSLILDNSAHTFLLESDEVMVTRRYYRSGESEYYINRQLVRLRDVNELFMDTGLGRDGYSMIGQGRIDEILSIKSSDRRSIFEEAAGISRFRYRKEESERKLERAEENLLRINDKISELELQVEPLREQAEKAKRYLILRDELRGLEVTVWLQNLERIALRARELEEAAKNAAANLDTAKEELKKLYSEDEAYGEAMRQKDLESESVRGGISEAESAVASLESDIAVLETNLKNNAANITRIEGEIAAEEGRDTGIRGQLEQRRARVEEIDEARKASAEAADGIRGEMEQLAMAAGEAAGRLEDAARRREENADEIAAAREKLSSLCASSQELEDRTSALLTETASVEEQLKGYESQAEENEKALEKAGETASGLKNTLAGYQMRLTSRTRKASEAADRRLKLTMDLEALRSRQALLTEMEKEYQGYSRAVKLVMQDAQRGILRNIHGPVANLIRAEDAYALAVETALGGASQDIVVSTEEDGKAAIAMLKRRDGGRATFQPMSVVKGAYLQERGLEQEPGFEGLAIDLVTFEEKYRGVVSHFLGRTAVAHSLDDAIRIARRYGHRFRIVTLDGQVMNAGGSMTGGSASKSAGILSRANELERIAGQRKLVEEDLEQAKRAEEDTKRELEEARYSAEVCAGELREAENTLLRLQTEKQHFDLVREAARERIDALRQEKAQMEQRAGSAQTEILRIREEIAALEAKTQSLREEETRCAEGCEAYRARREEMAAKLAENRALQASLEAEREATLHAVEELDALRRELSGGRQEQLRLMEALHRENESIRSRIAGKESEAAALREKTGEKRERLRKITEERMSLEGERNRRFAEIQTKNDAILDMERECGRLEQQKVSGEMEEKQIIDRLWDNYELSRTAAMEVRVEIESMNAATHRIAELRRAISRLGTPNIGAIEEFDRVNTRYTFLSEQRNDAEKARTELLEIIGDITGQMEEIFRREFARIAEAFTGTFTELFGGGRAELSLDDPEHILDCGIEIHAQPPGKALKVISLLSGGEKAFVAIALYFAILKVRPTPFVVMDEIESALDETNVSKFAQYTRNFTDHTQFLIITHRRGTMEEADELYGVTMQEQGVSKVLSVDLDEAEKEFSK